MLTFNALLGQNTINDLSINEQINLDELLKRLLKLEAAYGTAFHVTSGFRSMQQHMRIYAAKGIDASKVPKGSQHLYGRAADIADADGALKAWVLQNTPMLEDLGLWCEDFDATKTWCHFQTVPPHSGRRFFKP